MLNMENVDFIESIHNVELENDCPIFVSVAVLKPDFSGRRRIVSGKGSTREGAHQSCLAEAIERRCATFRKHCSAGVWGTEREMGPAAVSPEALLLISDEQYATADAWNRMVAPDHHLPTRRPNDQRIFWVEAKSLTRNTQVLVPAAYCFLGYPRARDEGFPVPDSSGLAAGKDLQICIARGLLELIERDAVSIWWYGQIKRSALQIDFDLSAKFKAWIERLGRRLWFLDLTTDLKVPVVAAITCTREGKDLSFGFGAGWTTEEAAKSAVGELTQFEATKRLMNDITRGDKTNFVTWSSEAQVGDYSFLEPSLDGGPSRAVSSVGPLDDLVGLLSQGGLETIALDLSREGLPFSVARAIVPGLRHIWPRFAPGRLYDVAVTMKWNAKRKSVNELNPQPIIY